MASSAAGAQSLGQGGAAPESGDSDEYQGPHGRLPEGTIMEPLTSPGWTHLESPSPATGRKIKYIESHCQQGQPPLPLHIHLPPVVCPLSMGFTSILGMAELGTERHEAELCGWGR